MLVSQFILRNCSPKDIDAVVAAAGVVVEVIYAFMLDAFEQRPAVVVDLQYGVVGVACPGEAILAGGVANVDGLFLVDGIGGKIEGAGGCADIK